MFTKYLLNHSALILVFVFINSGDVYAQHFVKFSNERLVISALESINSAEATFSASVGNGSYGTLSQMGIEGFIDPALATGYKNFYLFSIVIYSSSPDGPAAYRISAVPALYGKGGRRSFFSDQTGIIRGADRRGLPATESDPPVPAGCGESGAISAIRWILGAEFTYKATVGNGYYGTLHQLGYAGLINSGLQFGRTCSYSFTLNTSNFLRDGEASFFGGAVPIEYGANGFRSFYFDQNGVIRGADHGGGPANADDPPID